MSITITPCPETGPHETHDWQPEPKVLHGMKRCPGVFPANRAPIGPDGFTRLADLLDTDARLIRTAKAEALREAADEWPEDGMTRAEAQQFLDARAARIERGES